MNSPAVRFASHRSEGATPPSFRKVDVTLGGAAVDERGRQVLGILASATDSLVTLGYIPSTNQILIDAMPTKQVRLQEMLKGKTVRLEATTLGLAEILLTLRALDDVGIRDCEFVYVEPGEYKESKAAARSEVEPSFALTQNSDFLGIHGFVQPFHENAAHIYFVGYEQARLLKAIEQRDPVDPNCYLRHIVVGVPAFEAGWENKVFSTHVAYFEQIGATSSKIDYCAANSVQEAYLLLWDLYKQYRDDDRSFFVSPLGTKPHGIGAAMFLLETRGATFPTSLYYDHPVRVSERSRAIAAWHSIKVSW